MVKSSALRSVMYLPFLSFTITSMVIRCAFSLTVSSWPFGDCAGVADTHMAKITSKHAGKLIRGWLIKTLRLDMLHLHKIELCETACESNHLARISAVGTQCL